MGGIVESVLAPPTEACLAFEPLRAPRGQRFALSAHGLRGLRGATAYHHMGGGKKTRPGKASCSCTIIIDLLVYT